VLLVGRGNLLRRHLRRRAAGTAIVAHVGDVVDDDGLIVDVADLHVRDVVDGAVVEESAAAPIAVLNSPVVSLRSETQPTAVLKPPLVRFKRAFCPSAVLPPG